MQYSPIADPLLVAADLRARGEPFVMATVVRAVPPTSAKPGDKAVLTDDGLQVGWIGGSCAEPIVRREAERALADGECRLLLITPDENPPPAGSGRSVHKMECYSGGELEIYLEPFLSLPSLLVFGNSPVARALCDLGRVMRYAVTAVDLGDRPQMGPDITTVRSLQALPRLDASRTFAVVSSHGVFDEESLEAAVRLGLPYTGFVTSRKRRDQVFGALAAKGVSAEALARVQAPAGLDLGARQPEEIALAVMAEVVATRRRTAARAAVPREVAAPPPLEHVPATTTAAADLRPVEAGAGELVPHAPAGELVPDASAGDLVTLAPKAKSCCHGSKSAK